MIIPIRSPFNLSINLEMAIFALSNRLGLKSVALILLETSRQIIKSAPVRFTFSSRVPIWGFTIPIINRPKAPRNKMNLAKRLLTEMVGINFLITSGSPYSCMVLFLHLTVNQYKRINSGMRISATKKYLFSNCNISYEILLNTLFLNKNSTNNKKAAAIANGKKCSALLVKFFSSKMVFSILSISLYTSFSLLLSVALKYFPP